MTKKITVLEPKEVSEEAPFTHYILVALDDKGKEKGPEFPVLRKTFDRTFMQRTAKPDGTATKPQFKVKKKK